MKIIVNGCSSEQSLNEISYTQLVSLAGISGFPIITYYHPDGRCGILLPGQGCYLQEGSIFSIITTGDVLNNVFNHICSR